MEKIPSIFERGENFKVINKVTKGCEWVFRGEGKATEKLDGANVRLTIRNGFVVRVEKRRNPSTSQKVNGIFHSWYTDAHPDRPENKWIHEAAEHTQTWSWPDGEIPCEAMGPKIQGNPLGLEQHICVPLTDFTEFVEVGDDEDGFWENDFKPFLESCAELPVYDVPDRSFDALQALLFDLDSKYSPGHLAEGIVFHHPDGRRAKIKRKDFPLPR